MRRDYPYNTIVPFIQNFDLLVSSCSIVWTNPVASTNQQSCAMVLSNRNKTVHYVERVHVHTDYRHNKYFAENILPYFVRRHKDTGVGFILHTGGGDSATRPEMIDLFLKTTAIVRWIVEQSRSPELIGHPKVLFLPTGICVRENAGRQGLNLRIAMAESVSVSNKHTVEQRAKVVTSGIVRRTLVKATTQLANNTELNIHTNSSDRLEPTHRQQNKNLHQVARLLSGTKKHVRAWNERLDRILLCFGENGNEHRIKFMKYARSGMCSVCDYCRGSKPALELWRLYGKYKFVLSPYGNGADCGRTWEIMLMGAVPVIEYWPGALGYERGGLSTVTIVSPEELTAHNIHQWKRRYPSGQVSEPLSMEYWRDRIFDETDFI